MCEKGNKNPQTTKWEINANILFTQDDGSSLKINRHNLLCQTFNSELVKSIFRPSCTVLDIYVQF